MPQLMQVSSLIAALPVSLSIQMTSVPVRCGGQNVMHSRLQRFGWQRSLKTTAIRMEAFPSEARYLNVRANRLTAGESTSHRADGGGRKT
jgi:hypothetical protein